LKTRLYGNLPLWIALWDHEDVFGATCGRNRLFLTTNLR
jgi:hypothetical protein